MTSALFGPDGTQPPAPDAVLPDPLVAPVAAGDWTPPVIALPPLPLASDPEAIRRAVADALAQQPAESLRTPPTGIPVVPAPPSRPRPHQQPPPLQSYQRPPQQPYQQRPPPAAGRYSHLPPPPVGYPQPPAPPQARPQPQAQRPPQPRQQQPQPRRQEAQDNPLVQGRRSGGGWMGCLVLLIFLGAMFFSAIQSAIGALLDLVR